MERGRGGQTVSYYVSACHCLVWYSVGHMTISTLYTSAHLRSRPLVRVRATVSVVFDTMFKYAT